MHLKNESRLKSLIKGISWRIIGTIDTLFVAFLITGDTLKSLSIGGIEIFTKIFLYYLHERLWSRISVQWWKKTQYLFSFIRFKNYVFSSQEWLVNRSDIEKKNEHKGCVIWMTGLSGSGKTTIARHLEKKLFDEGYSTKILDGDVLRSGINADLGFSESDREENIRRTAEIAKIFTETGFVTIVSLITPKEALRESARQIIGEKDFHLVYVEASIFECERRDVKGLYAKARKGEIKDFTGVSAGNGFEVPTNAQIILKTEQTNIELTVVQLLAYLKEKVPTKQYLKLSNAKNG
jgi:adenylylsulfate kinase